VRRRDMSIHGEQPVTLRVRADPERGVYVCVPRSETAMLREYLDQGRDHYIVNPRKIESKCGRGFDLFLFGPVANRDHIRYLLPDYGFEVEPIVGDP